MSHSRIVGSVLFAGLTLGMTSCVERKEHLTITPGGSVMHSVAYKSDSADDLYEGDAVPRLNDGWIAEQQVEKDEDGKETYTLTAQLVFPLGAKLPANYASHNDPDADLYLQFPTTLTIEERSDGTYYHFARTYSPRAWAVFNSLQERHVQGPMAELKDVDPSEWTPVQRQMVARALATFETEKNLLFARAAYKTATPEAPQDGWLAVQNHMRDCLDHLDYVRIAKLLEQKPDAPEDELREQAVNAEIKGITDLLHDQLKQALFTQAGYSGTQYNRFMTEYDRRQKAYDITEDLGDDKFEITVEMPGHIVISNAESVSGSAAKWSFDGQIIRDRELELMATSRVAR